MFGGPLPVTDPPYVGPLARPVTSAEFPFTRACLPCFGCMRHRNQTLMLDLTRESPPLERLEFVCPEGHFSGSPLSVREDIDLATLAEIASEVQHE